MAGDTQAADAANAQVDIIGHILDSPYIELPFVDYDHLLAGKVSLPSLELFGIDLSITRHVVIMWVASILLIVLMLRAFRKPRTVPSGLANFFEAIVLFLRDEVVLPIMGEDGKKYLPFLLTLFFFILFCNLLGTGSLQCYSYWQHQRHGRFGPLLFFGNDRSRHRQQRIVRLLQEPGPFRGAAGAAHHSDSRRNNWFVGQALRSVRASFRQYDRRPRGDSGLLWA